LTNYKTIGVNAWGFLGRNTSTNALLIYRLSEFSNPSMTMHCADTRTGNEAIAAGVALSSIQNNAHNYIFPNVDVAPISTPASAQGFFVRHRDAASINCSFADGHVQSIPVNSIMDWTNNCFGSGKIHFSAK